MTQNRMPPHSTELEQRVLGAAMFFPADHLPPLLDACKPEDFYVPVHGKLLRLMAAAHARHEPIDVLALRHRAGADLALVELIDGMQPSFMSDVSALADEIALLAANRRTIKQACILAEQGYQSGDQAHPFFESSQKLVASMAVEGRVRSRPVESSELADEFAADMNTPVADTTFVRTGLHDLDRRLGGGLETGRVYVAAGRPGMGKSAFVFQALLNAAKGGHRALGFTLEMKRQQLQLRLVANVTGIESQFLKRGNRRPEDTGRILAACNSLSGLPFAIADDSRLTVQQLRTACRRERARRGLALVVVDYLQLMASDNRNDSREQEVSEISRELKKLAVELDVAVLAACQLNRDVEKRADKRPLLSDLRESGAIEQDADVVMLLYRDEYYNEHSKERGLCDIGVAKWRDGETGVDRVVFDAATSTFKTFARGA